MSRRLYYIDWLRVLAVLLLFPFHTSRVFNAGEDFYQKAPHLVSWLSPTLGFISTWHMQLLFLLAGASVYFSLRRRGVGQFSLERVQRLLVPLVFGIFVIIPPQTWVGGQFNSGHTGSFVRYITSGDFLVMNIKDGGDYYGGFGLGHLWFILFLFLLSLVALPLFAWGRSERGSRALARVARVIARPYMWPVVAFMILLSGAIPDPTEMDFFYYLVFFSLGYIIMFDDAVIASAQKHWWWAIPVGFAMCRWWDATGALRDRLPDPSLAIVAAGMPGTLGTWLVLTGMLGAGKLFLDRRSPALTYLAEASYPIYILHQTAIVVAAFYLIDFAGGMAWPLQWLVLLVASVALSYALYEIVRRVAVLRWLFGMRAKTPAPAVAPVPMPVPEAE